MQSSSFLDDQVSTSRRAPDARSSIVVLVAGLGVIAMLNLSTADAGGLARTAISLALCAWPLWRMSRRESDPLGVADDVLVSGLWMSGLLVLLSWIGVWSSTTIVTALVFWILLGGHTAASLKGWLTMMIPGGLVGLTLLSNQSGAEVLGPLALFIPSALLLSGFGLWQRRLLSRAVETERKNADDIERALADVVDTQRLCQYRLNSLSESMPIGVFEIDRWGRCTFSNSAWQTLSGIDYYRQHEIFWYDLIHDDDRGAARELWETAQWAGESAVTEVRLRDASEGERWVQIRLNPAPDDRGGDYVGTLEDITARRNAEIELHRYAESLAAAREQEQQHSAKLRLMVDELELARQRAEDGTRAKSEFLANMSHEIRTPMTAILGYTDLLLEQVNEREQSHDLLEIIKRNAEHLLEILGDILDLSKIEAGKLEIERVRCSPQQILDDVLNLMQVRCRSKGLTFRHERAIDFPNSLVSDPTRLKQILVNLLSNAIKFTPAGGTISVGLDLSRDPLTRGTPPKSFELRVSDNGIGMTQEQLKRLFRPFTQADTSTTRKFGGTGLGLTICKRFAEMMGGDIAVFSEREVGSTFVVTLPLTDANWDAPRIVPHADPKRASGSTPTLPRLDGLSILMAEDGPDNRKLVNLLLGKAGANLVMVENGVDAVEHALAAERRGAPYDVILMDMQMPLLDGYGATRQLRAAGYTLPILALTANAMSGDREKCLTAGCTDYLSKPLNRQSLIITIQRLVGRSAPEGTPPGVTATAASPTVAPQVS